MVSERAPLWKPSASATPIVVSTVNITKYQAHSLTVEFALRMWDQTMPDTCAATLEKPYEVVVANNKSEKQLCWSVDGST